MQPGSPTAQPFAATLIQPAIQAPTKPVAAGQPQSPMLATAKLLHATPPVANAGKAGGYRLQISAVRTAAAAEQEGERLKKAQNDLLSGITIGWSRVDLGERGTFYRTLVGPVKDRETAERICGALKKRSVGCIIARS
jgi:cell division septation protein DedD